MQAPKPPPAREMSRPALDALVQRALGAPPGEVEPMPGGASSRRYFRVRAGDRRAIAMFVPDAAPDEITSGATPSRWPFLEVQELLSAHGVRVPRVLAEACDEGLILIEDLGTETLAAYLEGASPSARAEIYGVAVRDLARAQASLATLPAGSVVATRAFDEPLLRWELDHYREWGLDALGHTLDPDQRRAFDAIADRLAARIAALPRGFVHRDYQSTNLMVDRGPPLALTWIDFQDALLGPRAYDLVALLCDSYQDLDQAFIDARLDDLAGVAGLDQEGRRALGREFDLVAVQRKLKDAGRFVFIDRVKGNPSYLRFVEPTLQMVRRSLDRLADDDDMRALSRMVPAAGASVPARPPESSP